MVCSLLTFSVNAFDYMLLGRMVTCYLDDDKLAGIKGSKMGVIFVCFDIMCVSTFEVFPRILKADGKKQLLHRPNRRRSHVPQQDDQDRQYRTPHLHWWNHLPTVSDHILLAVDDQVPKSAAVSMW